MHDCWENRSIDEATPSEESSACKECFFDLRRVF